MSSNHEFISDFFRTDIMNHCEFLKRLNGLGGEDSYLIAEICKRLVDQTNEKSAEKITPFYGGNDKVHATDVGHTARKDFQKHKSFPRNCFHIMKVYKALTSLDGHDYNIYELAYLNYHSQWVFFIACLIFSIQSILLYVVVSDNMLHFDVAMHQHDSFIILIDLCTTIFIIVFCYGQYTSAQTFMAAAKGVVGQSHVADDDLVIKFDGTSSKLRPRICLWMNQLVNQHVLSLAPFINFYFLLLSTNALEALLNGFSLLFIFELDDYILPLFAGVDIEDQLAINAHDFIMVPPMKENLSCKQTGPDMPQNAKLYVSISQEKKMINIYSRTTAAQYNKTSFTLEGPQACKFLQTCEDSLQCLQHFKDIHD